MPLATYDGLKTAVLDRIDRSDLTIEVEDWIRSAEDEMRHDLRTDWLEARAVGNQDPPSAFIKTPNDFNGLRNLQLDYGSYRVTLEQVSPDRLDNICPSTATGVPQYFSTHDEKFEMRPAPTGEYTYTITYYIKPDYLADDNQTNEFLVNASMCLFYYAVAEGYRHMQNMGDAQAYQAMYQQQLVKINKASHRRSWGEMPMRMMSDSAV